MKKKNLIFFVIPCIAITSILFGNSHQEPVIYQNFVPDKETAIKIAEAIWHPIYGDMLNDEKPFVARLKNPNVWIVEGTLKYQVGGVAYIEIQKKDCKILKVTHGK